MRRRALAAAAVAATALTAGGCGVVGEDRMTVTALFSDSVGLFPGNNVDILGVPVGTVTDVEPRGTNVEVRLSLPADLKIPADVGALIIPPTVITDRYVELTPAWTAGPVLTDGAVIPLARTRTPVEFDRIIRALDELVVSLGTDARTIGAIQDALDVGAKNLKGNGKRIKRSISGLSAAVGAFADNRDDLTLLIRSLDGLTETFARNDAVIRRFSRNVTRSTEVLADNSALLTQTVQTLAVALREVGEFVTTNSDAVQTGVRDLTALVEILNDHRAELTEALDVLPLLFQNLGMTIDPASGRMVFNASAAANVLNPVVLQQFCDSFGSLCPTAGEPIGSLQPYFGSADRGATAESSDAKRAAP